MQRDGLKILVGICIFFIFSFAKRKNSDGPSPDKKGAPVPSTKSFFVVWPGLDSRLN